MAERPKPKKMFNEKTVNVTMLIKSIEVSKWLMSHISKKDSKQQIKSLLSKTWKTLNMDEHCGFTKT